MSFPTSKLLRYSLVLLVAVAAAVVDDNVATFSQKFTFTDFCLLSHFL